MDREMRVVLRADLARNANKSLTSKVTLFVFRFGQHARGPARLVWRLLDRVVLRTLLGAELPPEVRCAPGLALPHGGRGVVMDHDVQIGANSMIFHRVTLAGGTGGSPRLANDVTIGVGAIVIGPVTIGEYAVVGANALVLEDVAPGEVVVGQPARSLYLVGRERQRAAAELARFGRVR